MIVCLASLVLAAAPLTFTVVWESGEASRDASSSTTTYTVAKGKMRHETKRSGRAAWEMKDLGPKDGEVTLKKPAKIAALLAAVDKVPAPKGTPEPIHETTYQRICLTREGKERCGQTLHGAEHKPDMQVLYDLVIALGAEQMGIP